MRRLRMSVIVVFTLVALAVLWGVVVIRKQNALADRQMCASQLISLGQAILLYCNENRGQLPASWRQLYLAGDFTAGILVCPASDDPPAVGETVDAMAAQIDTGGHCSYQYLGGGNIRDLTPDIVLAVEKPHHHGSNWEANVLFGDLSVRHMSGAASKQIFDAVARPERPVRYAGSEGEVMRKFPED